MHIAKYYYVRLRVTKIKECKLITSRHRVCKQNNPVQLTHLHEECEVECFNHLGLYLVVVLKGLPKLTKLFGLN